MTRVQKRFVDGPGVLTWFDLHITFDPRPLAPPGG
jgi:hypothetical protein